MCFASATRSRFHVLDALLRWRFGARFDVRWLSAKSNRLGACAPDAFFNFAPLLISAGGSGRRRTRRRDLHLEEVWIHTSFSPAFVSPAPSFA